MARSNKGTKFYICITPQETDLDATAFAALAWVEIKQVGSFGESGISTNMLTYNTMDTVVSQKSKGVTNAGDPPLEVARLASDPGQVALRTAGAPDNDSAFAFKEVKQDATEIYRRGLVAGPVRPGGRVEDFDLEVYTFGLLQKEIVVEPA